MNRRNFLKNFALTAAGLYVAPKTLIFDMGAHKRRMELVTREFVTPNYSIAEIQSTAQFKLLYEAMVKRLDFEFPEIVFNSETGLYNEWSPN